MLRLIAEWEKQEILLLVWPNEHSDWIENLVEIEEVYLQIIKAALNHQKIHLLCYDEKAILKAKKQIETLGTTKYEIQYFLVPTNDTWIRDFGPLSIYHDNGIKLINFAFNAWGNKYPRNLDNAATKSWHSLNPSLPVLIENNIILEGGAIDSNGEGLILTTTSCLKNPSRNNAEITANIEKELANTLGVKKIHWLNHGYLDGDDTDGHVDMLARFCASNHILYLSCDDSSDPHFTAFAKMENELKQLRDLNGKPYRLTALPFASAKFDDEERRLAASYANFLIINGAVLLPIYNDKNDEKAINILQKCFPDRTIYPIYSVPLIKQGGSIHCASMQIAYSEK